MVIAYILILLGLLLTAMNFGVIDTSVWTSFWKFWPVILIVVGVAIIGKKYMPKWLSVLIIILLILLTLIGVFWWSGYSLDSNGLGRSNSLSGDELIVDEPLSSDIKQINYNISLGAQELLLSSTSSGLVRGEISPTGGEPVLNITPGQNYTNINIYQKWSVNRLFNKSNGVTDLELSDQIPTNVDLKLGATKINADLKNIKLNKLFLKTGAINGDIKLGEKSNNIDVSLKIGASDIKVYIPKQSGLKVVESTGLVQILYNGISMVDSGDNQKETNNYSNSKNQINVNIQAGASKIVFEGY